MAPYTNPSRHMPRRVSPIAANAATSPTTGGPIGVWAAEHTHPGWAFTEVGYEAEICGPDGGALLLDGSSDR